MMDGCMIDGLWMYGCGIDRLDGWMADQWMDVWVDGGSMTDRWWIDGRWMDG